MPAITRSPARWLRTSLLTLARVRLQRLSPIGNGRNRPAAAENAANFFLAAAGAYRCRRATSTFAGFQELLRPGIIQALGDVLPPAKLSDRAFAAQAVEHDADLLFG